MTDGMTLERALELLRGGPEGVTAWNEWRKQGNQALPDLFMADLSGADLVGADLRGANLNHAVLIEADLARADLQATKLVATRFEGANLYNASLTGADLRNAQVSGMNVEFALCAGTSLVNLPLTEMKGLETVQHGFASHLSTGTFARSKGRIPKVFLRGCGLSDWEIEAVKLYDPALSEEQITLVTYDVIRIKKGAPIVYDSVFISYSTADQAFAEKIYADLQNIGVRCWFAAYDMQSGKKVHEQIELAISLQDRMLLILSESSMKSPWVKTEIANARKREREQKRTILFPIGLVPFKTIKDWRLFDADSGDDSAREIREYHIPNFEDWRDDNKYKSEFEKLVKALRADNQRTS